MEEKKLIKGKKMKRYTVGIDTLILATFEGIEANSEEEAKEIALDMFFDDIDQHIEINEKFDIDVYEEEADATPPKS